MRWRPAILGIAVLALLAFPACGKDDGSLPGAPEGVSDEEYLAVLCSGIESFSRALLAQTSPDGLRAVITEYADSLKAVTPPRDVSKFHSEYIAYVEEAVKTPALLASGSPPLPPQPARGRIASKQNSVEECKSPVFFAEDADS